LLDHGIGYKGVLTRAGMFHVVAFVIILVAIPLFQPADIERRLTYQGAR
jgi:hypothetical protein